MKRDCAKRSKFTRTRTERAVRGWRFTEIDRFSDRNAYTESDKRKERERETERRILNSEAKNRAGRR